MFRLKDHHKALLVKFQSLLALLLMVIVFSVWKTDEFCTTDNFWVVMRQISVNTCLSVGMTLVILTGGIDLSVGSVLALSGVVMAGLLKNGLEVPILNLFVGFNVLGAVLVGLIVGSSLGLFNGMAVTRFNVPPFVATLAMLTIARGLTELWTGGAGRAGRGGLRGSGRAGCWRGGERGAAGGGSDSGGIRRDDLHGDSSNCRGCAEENEVRQIRLCSGWK